MSCKKYLTLPPPTRLALQAYLLWTPLRPRLLRRGNRRATPRFASRIRLPEIAEASAATASAATKVAANGPCGAARSGRPRGQRGRPGW